MLKFLLMACAAYCLSSGTLSLLTGWRALTRQPCHFRYIKGARLFSEGSFRGVSARVAATPCRLSLEIYPEGLWLSAGIFHSLLMPAVLIPWNKISVSFSDTPLSGKRAQLQMAGHPGIVINGRPAEVVAEKAAIFQQ